jgi:transposase
MRPQGSQEQLEQRRRRAVELMEQGYGDATIAGLLGTSTVSVWRWRKAYRRRGDAALSAKPVSGRPPRLSARQRRSLVNRLLKGAMAEGFATDLWTCPRIAQVIEERYGVRYHVDHIPRLMAVLGFSCQKPERRAVERDEEAIRRWVKHDWPRIKKRRPPTRPSGFHR